MAKIFRFQSFGEPSQQICRMHWTTNCWTGSRASFFNFGKSNSPSGAKTAGHRSPLTQSQENFAMT